MTMLRFACELVNTAKRTNVPGFARDGLRVRVGLDSGPIAAGILGLYRRKFSIFGDTVNVAARMESNGTPGKIQMVRLHRLHHPVLLPTWELFWGRAFLRLPRCWVPF